MTEGISHLYKGEIWDEICQWPIPFLPTLCISSKSFGISHSLLCKEGGFVILRHKEVRDITAEILNEVCSNLSKTTFQLLTGQNLITE